MWFVVLYQLFCLVPYYLAHNLCFLMWEVCGYQIYKQREICLQLIATKITKMGYQKLFNHVSITLRSPLMDPKPNIFFKLEF